MSTVIKAGDAGRIQRSLAKVDLVDHDREALATVERAEQLAARTLEQARREAERVIVKARQAGYEAGFHQGRQEGAAMGREEARTESFDRFDRASGSARGAMSQAAVAMEAMKDDLRIAAERDVIDFAVRLSGKLAFAIGASRSEAVTANLQRALRLVETQTNVTIRVNPKDLETIRAYAEPTLQRMESARTLRVEPDESLSPGGCLVLTERAEVDASLETQVSELVSLLLDRGDGGLQPV